MSKQFTTEEVKQHNKKEDCWIILDGKVYDVTKFLEDHPGGEEVVIDCAGETIFLSVTTFDSFLGRNVAFLIL
jgi:cytochrome b involved in lipid metabolism